MVEKNEGKDDVVIQDEKEDKKKRPQKKRSFPAATFEDALVIANAIQEFASGQKVRRITLFDHLGKSPDSGHSRQMVINSGRYGLTAGGYQGEYLELTPLGNVATNTESNQKDKLVARFKLAIQSIESFNTLYEQYKNSKLPSKHVISDFLVESGFNKEETSECIDIFLINSKYIGILKMVAGAERLLPIEHVIEEMTEVDMAVADVAVESSRISRGVTPHSPKESKNHFDNVCFYITPIGEDGSEFRQHSDLFLNHIIEPAVKEFGLEVIRADKISDPGMISSQIIEHIIKSRLVIADLSYHNPNVFYELSIRHTFRLPCVQLIRKADKIPFDLDQVRTIKIDTSSIYTLVPQLDLYRSEISEQVRRALSDPEAVENPITAYSKSIRVTL